MSYKIIFNSAAERQFKKLPVSVQRSLQPLIDNLSVAPRPAGCKKIKGRKNEYRIRAGNYRVIYSIEDKALVVRVIRAGHRRDAYE